MSFVVMVFRLLWLRDVPTRVVGSLPELLWTSGEILSPPEWSPVLRDPRDPGPGGDWSTKAPSSQVGAEAGSSAQPRAARALIPPPPRSFPAALNGTRAQPTYVNRCARLHQTRLARRVLKHSATLGL